MKAWLVEREAERAAEGVAHDDDLAKLLLGSEPPEAAELPVPVESPFAVVVMVLAPQGRTVLVRDNAKQRPYWKMPGGKGEPGETIKMAAARELKEETGIDADSEKFEIIEEAERERPVHHLYYLLLLDISNQTELPEIAKMGAVDREEISWFARDQVKQMFTDVLPAHRAMEAKYFLSR